MTLLRVSPIKNRGFYYHICIIHTTLGDVEQKRDRDSTCKVHLNFVQVPFGGLTLSLNFVFKTMDRVRAFGDFTVVPAYFIWLRF